MTPEENTTKHLTTTDANRTQPSIEFDRLNEIRQHLSEQLDQLSKRHINLNIHQQLAAVDQWEYETIASIHRHTNYVKDKITTMFRVYTSELQECHAMQKRELNVCRVEHDLVVLSKRIELLDREIRQINQVLHEISKKEFNQIANRCVARIDGTEKLINWNYLHEIQLDSTYGYMAANNHQIFLGWKNRIVIYNLDGTKHDETRLQSIDTYGKLCDIVWSSAMQRFFILCQKSLFVHYPSSNQVEILSNISLIHRDNHYISITTYGNHLLLLHGKSLDLWGLKNDVFVLHHSILWNVIVDNPASESICCIRSNDRHLAVLIQNTTSHTWRLDFFHIFPFQCIQKGVPFDRFQELNLGLITAFHSGIYLFMNWETQCMRRIDSNGSNQLIDCNAYNACLLDAKRILIVNYMTHLKVFQC